MKKIINQPGNFVDEVMEGIVAAYGDRLKLVDGDPRVIVSNMPAREGKVGIVTGGGSGHLPVFLGYVGEGMLDGCAVGNVFASPSAAKMAKTIKACDRGSGVLCLYGNYGGDNMNFTMACEMVELEDDIKTATVRVKDDVASASAEAADRRRGVAGMVYAFKVAGAAAAEGRPLEAVAAVAQKALDNIRTMGIALSPCIVPDVGKPTFAIADQEVEIGMGIHGEPGVRRGKLQPADEIVDEMLAPVLSDIPYAAGDEVAVLINGLGATPLEELYVMYRRVNETLSAKGIKVFHAYVGEFATSMEMAGASISLLKLDSELKAYLSAQANTPFFKQFAL